MKLHIGCGDKFLPGFTHVDAREAPHVDHVGDVRNLDFLGDEIADEIYACHVLEHFGRLEFNGVLAEWGRILKRGGLLRLAVPDFEALVADYQNSRDLAKYIGLLYGGQDYQYNFHYMAYDFASLSTALSANGFEAITRYDWNDFLPPDFDDFSRAYIPHMDFENGRLVSLNVTALKS